MAATAEGVCQRNARFARGTFADAKSVISQLAMKPIAVNGRKLMKTGCKKLINMRVAEQTDTAKSTIDAL